MNLNNIKVTYFVRSLSCGLASKWNLAKTHHVNLSRLIIKIIHQCEWMWQVLYPNWLSPLSLQAEVTSHSTCTQLTCFGTIHNNIQKDMKISVFFLFFLKGQKSLVLFIFPMKKINKLIICC